MAQVAIQTKNVSPCAKGHYRPKNSTSQTQFKCPAGRYMQDIEGLQTSGCSVDCFLDSKQDDNDSDSTTALCAESKCAIRDTHVRLGQ